MNWVYVAVGGAVGSLLRYAVGQGVARFAPSGFPTATLMVNIAGSLAMGLLVGALLRYPPEQQEALRSFLAIGLLGGFTTFSAFSLDVVVLLNRGENVTALLYIIASVVCSVLGVMLGMAVKW